MSTKIKTKITLEIDEGLIEGIDLSSYIKKAINNAIVDLNGTLKGSKLIVDKSKRIVKLNHNNQIYRGITLRLMQGNDYGTKKAKRFSINNSNQNIWIPNSCLLEDGTIKENADLSFIFNKEQVKHKIKLSLNK